jgi:hypothetical protein
LEKKLPIKSVQDYKTVVIMGKKCQGKEIVDISGKKCQEKEHC